jgi:hypothetical protein
MKSLNASIYEYGKQVEKGDIKIAYQGLMNFIMGLKTHFKNKYSEYNVSGNIYQGYMDMTFFSLSPKSFRERDLKFAIVFIHEKTIFEVWLTGRNSEVQTKYRKLFRKINSNKYSISPDEKGVSSIIESVLVEYPNFDSPVELINLIDDRLTIFIEDMEKLLK